VIGPHDFRFGDAVAAVVPHLAAFIEEPETHAIRRSLHPRWLTPVTCASTSRRINCRW